MARRLLTVPGFLAAAALAILAAPVWLPALALVDAVRRRRLASLRFGVFITWLLACEAVGIGVSFWLWLTGGPWLGGDPARYRERNFRLQCAWVSALFRGAVRVFDLRVHVSGQEHLEATPLLLFLRHASAADTLLAGVLLAVPHRTRIRYVLKRELLWDPCLDIVGNRLQNHFVERQPDDSAAEIAAVGRLADDLGEGEAALIYPEGTRYSDERRMRLIARLKERGHAVAAERAERLERLLPPRPGGPLALLAHAPHADVVFCAHTGFEAAAGLGSLWAGELVGADVRVHFWRVAAAQVPRTEDAAREWLLDWWDRLDAWLVEHG